MIRVWTVGQRLTAARMTDPEPGSVSDTASHTGFGTSEVVSLTLSNMRFAAGWAYGVSVRAGIYGTAGGQCQLRVRKTNAAGTDWGEYGRVRCEGTSAADSAMANGELILLRTAGTDLTADVALTVAMDTGTGNMFGSATSPRYLLIRPIGAADEYAGLGVEVS